jgi:hypothetical protein
MPAGKWSPVCVLSDAKAELAAEYGKIGRRAL